jgi:4a-hydroxytetrahydrobiopterin dehydratase
MKFFGCDHKARTTGRIGAGNLRISPTIRCAAAAVSKSNASAMSDLAAKTCVPCRGGVPPLKGEELTGLQKQVDGWNIIEEHHITKTFTFPDFRGALKFVNRVGELAEEQGHHPDILLAWGKVDITTWTHKINGLTESDFVLAAKIDQLPQS